MILRNISIVIIGYSQVKKNIEQEGEAQYRTIHSKRVTCNILDSSVDPEYPDRFDQQVQQDDQNQVCDKLSLQTFIVLVPVYRISRLKVTKSNKFRYSLTNFDDSSTKEGFCYMNIAVNCRLLQKGKLEGIGWFMYETLKRITKDHPEHQFYFIFDRPCDPSFIFADNIKTIIVGTPARHPFLWYLWFEWSLPAVLKRINADLLFSPDGYISLRSNLPQIPVIHDINFAHRPKDLPFLTRHYYNYFFPRFARKANRICTVSEYSKKDIHQTYGIDKSLIHVVYNGANESYKPLNEQEKQVGKSKFSNGSEYFIFIGSIHPRKNLGNLIKGFESFVKRTGSELSLLVVGAQMWTTLGQSENGKGKKKHRGNVIFLGRLEAEELREVLGSALAMTFVPWFEGFGIPVLEAMYAGIPVLTSTETSLPEVGGNSVLYAHPGDVQEISEQMEKMATDAELRKELIQKGFQQKDNFSWDKTAQNVWECLDNVITGLDTHHD